MAGNARIGKGEAMVWNKRVLAKAVFIGALIGSAAGLAVLAGPAIRALPYTRPGEPHGFLPFDLVRVSWPRAVFGVPGGAIGGSFGAYMGKTGFANSYAPWIGCIVGAAILGVISAVFLYVIWLLSLLSSSEVYWCILC